MILMRCKKRCNLHLFFVVIMSLFAKFVISTEGRNHTRNSTKIGDFLCGNTSAISPFVRNDKIVVKSELNHNLLPMQF